MARADGTLSPLFTWRSAIASSDGPMDVALPVTREEVESFATVKGTTQRHVALTLSLHMNERGGSCWPGIARLTEESGLGERSVQRALRALEMTGWLQIAVGASKDGTNLYGATIPEGGVPGTGAYPGQERGVPGTPKDVIEDDSVYVGRAPKSVAKKRTTPAEAEIACRILDSFNEQAGTRYVAVDYVAKIILRHREHPELDLDAHVAIIRRALANPWWDGAPSPSVVYGNGALFERSMQSGPGRRTPAMLNPGDLDDIGGYE